MDPVLDQQVDPVARRPHLRRRQEHGQLVRKIGHLLPVPDGRLYGCDHGVCFGEEYKLRTVLWQWRGQKLPGRALTALGTLERELGGGPLATELEDLLSAAEVAATRARVELLIKHRVHPFPPENWPAVPWPPV